MICILIIYCYTYSGKKIVAKLQQSLDEAENIKTTESLQSFEEPKIEYKKEVYSIGQYTFDPAKNELYGCGESFLLNKKENAILYALCAQCGNVVERCILLSENWGSSGEIYSRSLDTYIAAIRKYLKKDPSIQIVTIKGLGYKIVC